MLSTIIPLDDRITGQAPLSSSDVLRLDVDSEIEMTISDPIGQSIAVVGTPGSGKSNTIARFLEQTRPYIPQHLLDIHNEYFGLAEKFDYLIVGKNAPPDPDGIKPKSPPMHVEVGAGQAAQIAEFAYRNRVSVIVQMLYMSPDERLEFAHAYCQKLWELNITATRPLIVLLEEAHNYIPQVIGNSPILKDFARFSSEGRKFGFINLLVTQRTAKINKDILADCNSMFLHKVNISNDFAVYAGMTPYDKAEIKKICLAMRPGDVIVKATTSKGIFFHQVQMLRRETFHGGSTPGLEESPLPALRMADGDVLEKLQKMLAQKPVTKGLVGDKPLQDDPARIAFRALAELFGAYAEQYVTDLQTALKWANGEIERLKSMDKARRVPTDAASAINHVPSAGVIAHAADRQPPSPQEDTLKIIVGAPADGGLNRTTDAADWDGRSGLATQRAINRQKNQFEALITDIKNAEKMHRLILIYLTQRENMEIGERDLAKNTGYSRSTLENHRPTGLERRGLVQRIMRANTYFYQSKVRRFFKANYPDLDEDALVERICKLERI